MRNTIKTKLPRKVKAAWREISANFTLADLRRLEAKLAGDDGLLLQGATVSPPDMPMFENDPAVACCPIATLACPTPGTTVRQASESFASITADHPNHRFFTDWWDHSPRELAFRLLLADVRQEINERIQSA